MPKYKILALEKKKFQRVSQKNFFEKNKKNFETTLKDGKTHLEMFLPSDIFFLKPPLKKYGHF